MPSSDFAYLFASDATRDTLTLFTQLIRERWAARAVGGESSPVELRQALGLRYEELVGTRNAYVHGATASSLLVQPAEVSETAIEALVRTQHAYAERTRSHAQHTEAIEDHQSTYITEWRQRIKAHSERSHEEILSSLWDSGLSWRDIARLLKVSVTAVQKWRAGDNMTSKNYARLRDFSAAYDMVAAHKPGVDIAAWLDVPILSDVPVTPEHLWTEGDPSMFFEYALGDLKPEAALDQFEPEWRPRYRDDGFETFVGADGNLSIRTTNR